MSGMPPLRMPGLTGAKLGQVSGPVGQAGDLPPIDTMDPGDAQPSICLVGASGTGKTEQLKRLIAHLNRRNLATMVLSVESKQQILATLRPFRIPIGAPVRLTPTISRPATASEKFMRLLTFRDRLRQGQFREHEGRAIGALVVDGLMEVGAIVKAHRLSNMPVSATGQSNTFRAFDEIGTDLIELMASLREAASDSGKAFGIAPLAIVATCGEALKDGKYQPLLPGNQAPTSLPYQFELLLRLSTETIDGATQYVAHTIPGETAYPQMGRWDAKAPGGLFDAKIVNPDLGAIYDKLTAYYRGENAATNEGVQS